MTWKARVAEVYCPPGAGVFVARNAMAFRIVPGSARGELPSGASVLEMTGEKSSHHKLSRSVLNLLRVEECPSEAIGRTRFRVKVFVPAREIYVIPGDFARRFGDRRPFGTPRPTISPDGRGAGIRKAELSSARSGRASIKTLGLRTRTPRVAFFSPRRVFRGGRSDRFPPPPCRHLPDGFRTRSRCATP